MTQQGKTNITYRWVGDYKIPNIALPAEANKPIGIWGLKRKAYLMKHKRVQFNIMLMNGTLWNHLEEIDEQASDLFSRLIEQIKVNEGITEKLKEDDQMEWVQKVNSIQNRVWKMVLFELIVIKRVGCIKILRTRLFLYCKLN